MNINAYLEHGMAFPVRKILSGTSSVFQIPNMIYEDNIQKPPYATLTMGKGEGFDILNIMKYEEDT
ncbi:hypothetical protein FRX31_023420 [Thalictrum thalictroides]|uniref:Uncharacterized protein n=1 Tax=Thalictrum thalictroides TaxID=46969 RepID=A0A7J6VQ36_THATH|nr:hypothetical protein FRX31_023420 [Thalictrum thalictroides]